MSDKNNGWKQPEEKYVEKFDDNFENFFSAEETEAAPKGRRRKKNGKTEAPAEVGPDILAETAADEDTGFVIKEVVAVEEDGSLYKIKAEDEPQEENAEAAPEAAPEAAANETSENSEAAEQSGEEQEETQVVDLSPKEPEEKKYRFFPRAKKIIEKKRKHRYVAAIGAALIILAVIGSISVISSLVGFTGRLIENAGQKEEFEWKIYPLLMLDPATFEDPSQLDDVFVLKTALWSTLLENRSVYSYDENGLLIVPASDLDVSAKKLYGSAVTLKHQTFSEGYEFFYVYNEETNSYSVPISGQTAGYTPKVVKINKSGDIYTLIVGYVAPTTLWNVSESGVSATAVPDKYLYYDLQKTGRGSYIVKAVRAIPQDELPSDLETAEYQSINQTQYFDYEQKYQDYLAGLQGSKNPDEEGEENTSGETSSAESGGASSEGQ